MKNFTALALFLPFLLFTTDAQGEEMLVVGDTFPRLDAQDQHGEDYVFAPGTKVVIIAFDMGPAKKANKVLAGEPADYLARNNAVFISNIYGMPRIGRYFALPKMKKYPHRIILADTEGLLASFPRREERVTVMRLDSNAVVEAIDYWNPDEASLGVYLH